MRPDESLGPSLMWPLGKSSTAVAAPEAAVQVAMAISAYYQFIYVCVRLEIIEARVFNDALGVSCTQSRRKPCSSFLGHKMCQGHGGIK